VDKLTLAQVCRTAEHAKSSPQEMHCAMWTHGQVAQMAQALLDSQQAIRESVGACVEFGDILERKGNGGHEIARTIGRNLARALLEHSAYGQ